MAGLYIHIPFCEKICPYCDFSTWKAGERQHNRWLNNIKAEATARKSTPQNFDTLYLGGGTPSLLRLDVLEDCFHFLRSYYNIDTLKEFSLESNPGNLTIEKVKCYKDLGVSRISLGAQSFDSQRLKWLGRNHGPSDIYKSVELCHKFEIDVNIDIIFGSQDQSVSQLLEDLNSACSLFPQHISLYGLSYEANTLFSQHKEKGLKKEIEEELYIEMYLKASDYLESQNIKRYEVSNFSLPGKECIHNMGYWNHSPYLGLGPGAHSLIGNCRYFNSKKFAQYEKHVMAGYPLEEDKMERLSLDNRYHEKIWLSLRTVHGLDLKALKAEFNRHPELELLEKWIKKAWLVEFESQKYRLEGKGWALIDALTLDAIHQTFYYA